jgi:hypothetical protein
LREHGKISRDKLKMNRNISSWHYFLNLTCVIILLVGLGSAIAIYMTSQDESDDNLEYQIVGDKMYPAVPNKMYRRNLEVIGGKGLVLADDVTRWFNELWHGRSFAITIAILSIITAGVIFFFNNYVSFEDETHRDD